MQSLKSEEAKVDASSLMVSKKHQIFSKMKFYSRSDFYDLDQQIKNNKEGLYRKLNVALRKTRLDCTIKLDNPFLVKKETKKERLKSEGHLNKNTPERQLSKLIFNVQPYWVKRSFVKPHSKQA